MGRGCPQACDSPSKDGHSLALLRPQLDSSANQPPALLAGALSSATVSVAVDGSASGTKEDATAGAAMCGCFKGG